VDALLLLNAILAGVIVGIGAYGHRYRHYGFTRYILLGVRLPCSYPSHHMFSPQLDPVILRLLLVFQI
jgi:hypothetical protein